MNKGVAAGLRLFGLCGGTVEVQSAVGNAVCFGGSASSAGGMVVVAFC